MKKRVLGYIYSDKNPGKDEKAFIKVAKRKGMEMIMFNLSKELNEQDLEEKANKCDIIFNNSGEDFAFEIIKTFEELGKKVIESSKSLYYPEDKWVFYMECKRNNIPVPETMLLSENIFLAKKELNHFGHWPVILKRVSGTWGQYVEKAENIKEAEAIINKFWGKTKEKLPIIAQQFIRSPSYRVTLVNGEIVQTALKENKGWKSTGVYEKSFKKFIVDKNLGKIVKKLAKITNIKVLGVDLLKNEGDWIVLEVNSTPAFDFFEDEREMLAEKIIDYLKTQI
ncbi:MAG: ATP-grasp domain-containing protein [Nanoarchaeota archaeon]|nr:ATP-grasp domain-containing protein [Nanoarchaeota archaeon]